MIKIRTSDSHPLTIIPEVTQPCVYLDYCIIVNLAKDHKLGTKFRECLLQKGGTLYLSWAHLIELFGVAVGATYYAVRSYLASFGRSFILIDNNAKAVIAREAAWAVGKQNPVFSEELLLELLRNWDGMSELDITTLLDVMASNPSHISRYKALLEQHKVTIKQAFDNNRQAYKMDSTVRNKMNNATYSYNPGTPPTNYIYQQMKRQCVITNEEFNESDSIDFEHCIVSVAYCDYVVLDKKWARRCKSIDIPPGAGRVFSSLEVEDLVNDMKLAS